MPLPVERTLEAVHADDVAELRRIARETGFGATLLRRLAWPLLLAEQLMATIDAPHRQPGNDYERQVRLDINRSFGKLYQGSNDDDDGDGKDDAKSLQTKRRAQLSTIIHDVLNSYPQLNYYQGFHDICSVLLLVLEQRVAQTCAKTLSIFFIRDAMHQTLEPVMSQMLILLPLIKSENRPLYDKFERCQLQPYFCLSWIITWFSHDLDDFDLVCRLFDFLVASNPIMPVYISAAVVLAQENEVMELDDEFAMLHAHLSTCIPAAITHDTIETVLKQAHALYTKYPVANIELLTGWKFRPEAAFNTFDDDFSPPFHTDDIADAIERLPTYLSAPGEPTPPPYAFKPLPLARRLRAPSSPLRQPRVWVATAVAVAVLSVAVNALSVYVAEMALGVRQ
ncbi:GTPase-activating protein gyp8 [Sorochytrium milnesiophthora]